jgi:quinol monooxygenase YgiN
VERAAAWRRQEERRSAAARRNGMYGTIGRMRVKPGKIEELRQFGRESSSMEIPALVSDYLYQTDEDPNVCYLVVGFESREAYRRNAQSPEQAGRYERYRALLDADPEWHYGEIINVYPPA